MAEIILVCKTCDKQPQSCRCKDKGSFGDNHWLKQEPVVRIRDLRVPLYLAKGQLELLTDGELNDYYDDLRAEYKRRERGEYSTLAQHRADGESG